MCHSVINKFSILTSLDNKMTSLNITNYDPDVLKADLIKFLQSNPEFKDFDYQGSTINTIIDLLVRNTYYVAYMANMTATESFLDSAMIRQNLVSHAQKLSYKPSSRTAATVIGNILINTEGVTSHQSIDIPKGFAFTKKIGNTAYRFITLDTHAATLNDDDLYEAKNVVLKQGILVTEKFVYKNLDIEIRNKNVDTSTIRVFVSDPNSYKKQEYTQPDHIISVSKTGFNFFLYENTRGTQTIQFGKNILGKNPNLDDVITVEYLVCEEEHGNGITDLMSVGNIGDYQDIKIDITTPGFGGGERDDLETIRFIAPKIYKAQRRAVNNDDYQALVMDLFPYVKSCNVWSGANNINPDYGAIYISCSPKGGYGISESAKDEIKDKLAKYKVGVTRINIVDPTNLHINVNIKVDYNSNKTDLSWSTTSAQILSNIKEFENKNLGIFNGKFNSAKFVQEIVKNTDVEMIDVEKTISQSLPITQGLNTIYDFDFANKIEPGSFKIISQYEVFDYNSSKDVVYDKDGIVFLQSVINGKSKDINIGTIDYETGIVSLKATILEGDTLTVKCKTSSSNINSRNNIVLQIGNISINRGS